MPKREKPTSALRLAPEVTVARCALLQDGLNRHAIAQRLGRSPETISTWIARGFASESSRWKFEAALGYRRPIWSTRSDLKLRRRCVEVHGFDPFLVSRPVIRERARGFGLRVLEHESLPAIRKAVMAWLAANLNQSKEEHP